MRSIAPFVTFASVFLFACTAAAAQSRRSNEALVFLHPAEQGSGKPAAISSVQLNRVLSHHLHVPNDASNEDGLNAGHVSLSESAWDWLPSLPMMYKGREMVKDASSDDVQRTLVLLHGMDNVDIDEVLPASMRQTHSVYEAPHQSSFDALAHAYGERVYGSSRFAAAAAQSFAGFFAVVAEGMEHALEDAGSWLTGNGANALAASKKVLDQTDLVDRVSRPFYESLRNLVAYLDTIGSPVGEGEKAAASPYQALRFEGLGEIKAAYGEESREYQQARQALRNLLEAAVQKMDSVKSVRTQSLALIVVPSRNEAHSALEKRGNAIFPFRANLNRTPFLSTRSVEEEEGGSEVLVKRQTRVLSSLKANTTAPVKDSDLSAKCFKSAEELNKASQNCTEHGTPAQSSRGGRKCFRCKCDKDKAKNGKITEWTGEACQRKSIAKPFALLAFTTLGLLVVTFVSVYFLLYEGMAELPSVLAGISIPSKMK